MSRVTSILWVLASLAGAGGGIALGDLLARAVR